MDSWGFLFWFRDLSLVALFLYLEKRIDKLEKRCLIHDLCERKL